ncbi:MAG TPA: SOS response-associated peptidase [Candidatus Saccharimonadales bacterium]|nr:SOS response-associated peptidase [Candidatus Saccharimonadales bacterium]
MCGRYTLNKKADDVARRFQAANQSEDLRANYNVSPTQVMPVVTEDEAGTRHLEQMQWGIPRMLGKDLVKELINTRADKAFGGFWKRTVLNRRCLIPATGFYEWRATQAGKIPYFIHPKKIDLYAFAGIWDIWQSRDGHKVKVYSIMTTEPNKEMKAIHNRMPVILHREDEATWIEPSNDKQKGLEPLLLPFEDHGLEIYEVSRDVNNPRNNNESLLEPIVA